VSDPQPRFLIVRLGSLGDVIHAIPAVAALRQRYPAARIDWVVDPRYVDLLKLVAGIDSCIPLDPRESWIGVLKTVRGLRRTRYEAAIDLQGLLKSAFLARAAGARRTIGFPRAQLREPLASALYSETPDPGGGPHVIHTGLGLMRTLGVINAPVAFPLTVPRTPAADVVISRLGPGGYALINPGAAWPNKRWPAERFGVLAAAIAERRGLHSVVLWGPGEESMAAAVVAASRGAAELAPPTSNTDQVALATGAQ
jgi:heptosyltransferase-1